MEHSQKTASFWEKGDDGIIQCNLCPHHCKIENNQQGICKVRGVLDDELKVLYYKKIITGGQLDPIEKKPLFHFHPGSTVLSFGSVSCNLKCGHCQNCSISQNYNSSLMIPLEEESILRMLEHYDCEGIAWTYNEPTIHFESYYDLSQAVKEKGYYTVWISNGFINPEPFKKIAPLLDAVNIDVKSFQDDFYKKVAKARIQPVLDTCVLAHNLGVHLELTYLIIPTYNDTREEIEAFLDWVINHLGYDVPIHFSRFHPAYKMINLPATDPKSVIDAVELAFEKNIHYAYAGNLYDNPYESTLCPSCKKMVIQRQGYQIKQVYLDDSKRCIFCNEDISILF